MRKSIPRQGDIYKHYKGMLYQIVAIAMHTETEEDMVVYQALYGEFKHFARPLSMFMEEVEVEGSKICRFELINTNDNNNKETKLDSNSNMENREKYKLDNSRACNDGIHEGESVRVNEYNLMDFLDVRASAINV